MDKDLIDLLFMSNKRRDLLLLLKDGGRKIEDITTTLHVTQTGMLPQIKKLKEESLISQENKEYKLTPLAEILVEKMGPLLDTLEVIEKNSHYWQERDLSSIPHSFLERLNELKSCTLIEPDSNNIFEPPTLVLENIKKSKKMLLFSSIFHPIFPEIFRKKGQDTEITLIVTKKIYERLKKDFESELEFCKAGGKMSLFVCVDEIKIAMIIKTESFMSVDFLTFKGAYDQETIIGIEPAPIKWAEDLILHIRNRAQEIQD
jgi:predicted transcriptional regulator